MPTPREVRAHLAGLEGLHRPVARLPLHVPEPRPLAIVLGELRAGGQAVEATTSAWSTESPTSRAALDSLQSTLTGMHRLCGELRQALDGGPTDADS